MTKFTFMQTQPVSVKLSNSDMGAVAYKYLIKRFNLLDLSSLHINDAGQIMGENPLKPGNYIVVVDNPTPMQKEVVKILDYFRTGGY